VLLGGRDQHIKAGTVAFDGCYSLLQCFEHACLALITVTSTL
jgi:hypothetical protein